MEGEGFRLLYLGLWGGHFLAKGIGWLDPLQYSCLESPVDRGAWWAAAYGIAQSRTRLKRLSSSSSSYPVQSQFILEGDRETDRERGRD